jgi:hypothetical protein
MTSSQCGDTNYTTNQSISWQYDICTYNCGGLFGNTCCTAGIDFTKNSPSSSNNLPVNPSSDSNPPYIQTSAVGCQNASDSYNDPQGSITINDNNTSNTYTLSISPTNSISSCFTGGVPDSFDNIPYIKITNNSANNLIAYVKDAYQNQNCSVLKQSQSQTISLTTTGLA